MIWDALGLLLTAFIFICLCSWLDGRRYKRCARRGYHHIAFAFTRKCDDCSRNVDHDDLPLKGPGMFWDERKKH